MHFFIFIVDIEILEILANAARNDELCSLRINLIQRQSDFFQ